MPPEVQALIDSLTSGFTGIMGWVPPIIGALFVLMIIYGGLVYLQGNAENGKKIILAAIIGAAIVMLATIIISLLLGGSGLLLH
ncbi:hypothetical protein A2V68_00800 [candidate division Kazan bacterium RBG_13_50_9]|uniref:Uncharacterized protein n=1 Tax=candidate division Kazan bacterium RBG_13_50_9 TaxID=1798535 RepID=A0A1F4NS47_UNCK3|nr:MAG: hypothetical protein A2V68_00800 [candidate division Kazan bacterium RBG_13_50_9]